MFEGLDNPRDLHLYQDDEEKNQMHEDLHNLKVQLSAQMMVAWGIFYALLILLATWIGGGFETDETPSQAIEQTIQKNFYND